MPHEIEQRARKDDAAVSAALLLAAVSWAFCAGCVVLHMAGVQSRGADIVSLALSGVTALVFVYLVAFKRW